MGHHYRRKHESGAVRQQIVAVATELFLNEGYESVSMRKIAQKIEYSPTTIYTYFKNKEEILQQILQAGYAIFLNALQDESERSASVDFMERFRNTLRAYVRFGMEHPDYYRIIFIDNPEQIKRLIAIEESDRIKGLLLLENFLTAGMQQGLFRQGDFLIYSRSVWASLHGLVSLLIEFPPASLGPQVDRLIDEHLDFIVRGLSPALL